MDGDEGGRPGIDDILEMAADAMRSEIWENPEYKELFATEFERDVERLCTTMQEMRHKMVDGRYDLTLRAVPDLVSDSSSGPYDEWKGVVRVEVPVAVYAVTGRPKHTDPTEVAEGIRTAVSVGLQRLFDGQIDVSIGKVALLGWEDQEWEEDLGDLFK